MATAKTPAAKKAPSTAVAVSRKPNLPVDVEASPPREAALRRFTDFRIPRSFGQEERESKMSNVIHRKRFDHIRRRTPQEMHRELAFPPGTKCHGCGHSNVSTRAVVMMHLKDALAKGLVDENTPKSVMAGITVPIQENPQARPEPYLRVSMAYACDLCLPGMERELAKAPSWAIVEITRG